MGKVQQQFFPGSSWPEITLDLWLPEGTSFTANDATTKRVEERLPKEDGMTSVATWVGLDVSRFYLATDQLFPQSKVSQLIVLLKDLKVR